MGRLRDKPKTRLRRKLNLTLILPNLTVCCESLYTIVTKSLPMCIFFELQPGSESLVGIKVATWKMTERRKQQYQKDQRYLSIEEMQQQQHSLTVNMPLS